MSNSSVFKSRLKVLRSSADLQLYDSEFQTDGALTQKCKTPSPIMLSAFAVQQVTVYQQIAERV